MDNLVADTSISDLFFNMQHDNLHDLFDKQQDFSDKDLRDALIDDADSFVGMLQPLLNGYTGALLDPNKIVEDFVNRL